MSISSIDVLSAEPPSSPGRGRWFAMAGASLAVVALAGGGYAAYGALSGGGTQPEKFVPANAIAYVELDLNPPASQKINAVRLLHKLPKTAKTDDYRDALLSTVFSGDQNFKTDVDPWLGDRVAFAALPPVSGRQPVVEGVLQVKDEAAFKAAAPKLLGRRGYVLRDGFVIVADDAASAQRISTSAAKADLADDPDYTLDTSNLGDRVVTGWYDASRAASLVSKASEGFKGRGTFAVHVESNAVELVANQTGGNASSAGKVALLPKLPSDTVAAVEVTGIGQLVMSQWAQLMTSMKATGVNPTQLIDTYEKQYGIKLPDDLSTLLGSDTLAAVTASGGKPGFGFVSVTDKAKAADLIKRIAPELAPYGGRPVLTANGIAWGSLAMGGDLGSKVKSVLPDLASAQFALYVDVAAASHLSKRLGGSAAQASGVDALGVTASSDGTKSQIRIRLSFN
jgi:Protein of unknown function (DUF3352)